jgi:hypothetical protein
VDERIKMTLGERIQVVDAVVEGTNPQWIKMKKCRSDPQGEVEAVEVLVNQKLK